MSKLNLWRDIKTGSGTITPDSSGMFTTCAGGSGSAAFIRRVIPAVPGDMITVRGLAKKISGEANFTINYPAPGNAVTTLPIRTGDLELYLLHYRVPYEAVSGDLVIDIGVSTAPAGDMVIYDPTVLVNGVPAERLYPLTREFFVAPDAAVSFTPAGRTGILQVWNGQDAMAAGTAGICSYDIVSTTLCEKLCGGVNFATTTGMLTGTSGAADALTVSAHSDGKIYLENRMAGGFYRYIAVQESFSVRR